VAISQEDWPAQYASAQHPYHLTVGLQRQRAAAAVEAAASAALATAALAELGAVI